MSKTATDRLTLYFVVFKSRKTHPVELFDIDDNLIYEETFLPSESGAIVDDQLPEGLFQLEKMHRWRFSTTPEEGIRTSVSGWLKQTSTDDEPLQDNLSIEEKLELAQTYAEEVLWLDAIALTTELHKQYPDDQNVQTAWAQLLQSLRLDITDPFAAIR